MSVFERHDIELGRFSIRPLVLETDAELVHGWVTHEKAAFWPTPGTATVAEVAAEYRMIQTSPWHDAFIGLHEGRPAFLVERYDPAHDELANAYEAQEGDIGMHFLVGPTDHPVHGFTHAVIATVMEFVFSDPAVRRVVVEPDVCNRAVQELNAAVGFRVAEIVALSYKEALLSTCTREQYQASRQPAVGPRTMTDLEEVPARVVAAHLDPERWERANRLLVAKALAEFSHERLLAPQPERDGRYRVAGDDARVTYAFDARRLALDHWQIDSDTITRRRAGDELAVDALGLVLDLRETLGLEGEQLGLYLEELSSTLAASAFKLASAPMSAADLAGADFQTIESRMTEGHPCFVANSGRIGFDAADFLRYAPEAAAPVRLIWVAAHREAATFSAGEDLDERRLFDAELGAATLARFERTMGEHGLDLADYHLIPVHPWQWLTRLAVTFAGDVARRRLVCLGPGDDEYLAQQSIRTFFNTTDPCRHYVKTALSVVNMGFVRGLSAAYMEGTPAINDWVADLVAGDEGLRESGFSVLRERAAVGYRSDQYEAAEILNAPYSRMLAALWRESPVPKLRPGERLATMASLLHVDEDGGSLAGSLIERSGLPAQEWLRRYLAAYLRPLLHCFYAHQLVFMPHGENIILVLEDDVPTRVILKDIGEEVILMDPDTVLPDAVRRIFADVPAELRALSILTDVFDCFLRFLNAILVREGTIGEDGLWEEVAACVHDYQRSAPQLADRFETYDLFTGEFALSCLNRLQLRDSRQMVNLQDPAGSLQFAGTLSNPLARFAGEPRGNGGGRARGGLQWSLTPDGDHEGSQVA